MTQRPIVFCYVLLFVLAVTACGAQPGSPSPAADSPVPTSTSPPAATETVEPAPEPTPTAESRYVSDLAQRVLDRGTIRIGTRTNSLLPFIDVEGDYSGFEAELAESIVGWLFEGAVTIEWIGLSAGERFTALADERIELLIRTTVHTQSRDAVALWSDPYFIGGLRLLVRDGEGITDFIDLAGKRVSVVEGTPTQSAVQTKAASLDIEVVEVISDSNDAAISAFNAGEADAFVSDWVLLMTLKRDDPSYRIVGEFLSRQPFAIGVRLGEEAFRDDINRALRAVVEDGTYEGIYARWIDDPHPWTLDEMLSEPPMEG